MARLPRFYLPSQPLHVIQRGNNRDPIFAADADYHFYLRCLQEVAETPLPVGNTHFAGFAGQ